MNISVPIEFYYILPKKKFKPIINKTNYGFKLKKFFLF